MGLKESIDCPWLQICCNPYQECIPNIHHFGFCISGITSYFDSEGKIREFFKIRLSIISVLIGIGMTPSLPKLVQPGPPEFLSVLLDGCVVGSIPSSEVEKAVTHLRRLKLSETFAVWSCQILFVLFLIFPFMVLLRNVASQIPGDLEVGYVPLSMGGAYPGLFLFTCPSRFVRPVRNISVPSEESHNIELIGPFEQVYSDSTTLSYFCRHFIIFFAKNL